MGCCISRPSGPNSPYPGGVGVSGSARAINDAPQPVARTASQHGGGGADDSLPSPSSGLRRHRHRHHSDQPLDQHINKPLRRHDWVSRNRTWTSSALERERREFFDTRVTGRQEIWQALRAALEMMWEADTAARNARIQQQSQPQQQQQRRGDGGRSHEDDHTAALATAQTILNAAEITLPTGDLANGAYDTIGNYYPVPEHIVSDPINISLVDNHQQGSSQGHPIGLGDAKGAYAAGDDTVEEGGELEDEDAAARRREEKGKAVLDMRDLVPLRARLSEGSQDVSLLIGRGETVRSVARRIAEESSLPGNKKIRLAYMGKIMKEGSALADQGWKQGHVVNALVFNR